MSDDRSPIGIVNQEAADRRRQRRKVHMQIIEEDRKRLREENDRLTAKLAAVKEESAETCRKLLEDNHRIEVQLAEVREKYNAIIMEVSQKTKGEERWETASRIIREREERHALCQGRVAIDASSKS
jgi:hypothetical protein